MSYLTFAEFLLEDSYISLRYATHFAAGEGLIFQTGAAVLGTSSPLWAMLLAMPIALGVHPEVALDVAFSASMAGFAYAGGRLLQRLAGPRTSILFALAVSIGVGRLHAYWGMETALFLAWLFGGWCLALDRRYTLAGVVLGLACLTRYEGYAFAASLALILAWQESWKAIQLGGIAIAAVTLPWLLHAWLLYGSPIPVTAAAKASHVSPLRYLERSYLDLPHDILWPIGEPVSPQAIGLVLGVLIGVFGIIGLLRLLRTQPIVALALPLGALFVFATLIALAPGPAFAWHRAPVHFTGIVCALVGAGPWIERPRYGPLGRGVGLAAIAASLLGAIPMLQRASTDLRSTFQYAGRESAYIEIAEFLVETHLNQSTVLTWEPGYLAYMSGTRVIDLVGLVTPAPEFTKRAMQSWDSEFPPEAELVLLRAPYRPAGYTLIFEGSMGSWLFAREAIAERHADAIAAFRSKNAPMDEARPLSAGPVQINPSFKGAPFITGPPGTLTQIDPEQEAMALTAETPLLRIDAPHMQIEFQTSTPNYVQLQLVVRGEVVLSTDTNLDQDNILVLWDVSLWEDRTARVRLLGLAGDGAKASFGTVRAVNQRTR